MTDFQQKDIFDPEFVKGVFDRCGTNYRWWSQVASFGFVWLWRKQCIAALSKTSCEQVVVIDLMAGTGETWPLLIKKYPRLSRIVATDISTTMVERAIQRLHSMRSDRIEVCEANVLRGDLPAAFADVVVCSFGLKTFDPAQQRLIAEQLAATLRPGGVFSFVEASDPVGWPLRNIYRTYMTRVLPWIERTFLNGAQDFAMIGAYTAAFRDCSHFASCCAEAGLQVRYHKLFFGCATAVSGKKL